MTSDRQKLGRDVSVSAIGTVALRLAGAAGGVLVARLLGPESRGVLALHVIAGSLIGTALAAGLPFWIIKTTAGDGLSTTVTRIVRLHLAVAATAATFGTVVTATATDIDTTMVILTGGLAFAWVFGALLIAIPNGLRQMRVVVVGTAGGGAVYCALVALLLAADRPSVRLAMLATALAQVWVGAVGWRHTRRVPKRSPGSQSLDGPPYRRALAVGAPGAVGEVFAFAVTRVDVLLVGALVSVKSAGIYVVARTLAEVPLMIADAVAPVMFPYVAEDASARSTDRLSRLTLLATLATSLLILLAAPFAVPLLFGADFRAAVSALPALLAGAAAIGVWKLAAAELSARGLNGPRATSSAAGLVAVSAVGVVMIPWLETIGASVASAIGALVATAVIARRWSHETGRPASRLFAISATDAHTAAAAIRSRLRRVA